MYVTHEYLTTLRQQELIRDAQRARRVRGARPHRPWRRQVRRALD